jgi:hypothetical protein
MEEKIMKKNNLEKILENLKERETYDAKEITKALKDDGFEVKKRQDYIKISKDGKYGYITIVANHKTGYELFGIRLLQALEEVGYLNS